MSATNHTSNYELSQYIGSDEPKYLTDYNGDMQKIDVAIKEAKTGADTANTGVATNAASIQTLDGAVSSLNGQVSTVATATNGNTASINTINSLIGNGEPTTSDKTIIGAINEIYADITGGGDDIEADNVKYDNTTSGLTADDVQDAIDEVVTMIPSVPATYDADDVTYDNTTSGLTATNVQDAIDELAGGTPASDHGVYELWANSNPSQAFAEQTVSLSDITGYDALWIAFEHDTTEHNGAELVEVDVDRFATVAATVNFLSTVGWSPTLGAMYCGMREATFTKVGDGCTIQFAKGQRATVNALGSAFSFSDYNEVFIPVRILGIKHNS